MVSLPVPPVKAPSPNSCSPASKPFPCHTFTRSSKSSTLSSATATPFDSIFGVAKPFALISFADPRPLNSVVSYRYKKSGERAVSSHETVVQLDCIFDCANSFALNSFADPHPLNLYGSIFYKKVGGRGGTLSGVSFAFTGNADLPIGVLVSKSPIFHSLPTFRIRRTIPPARSLPPKNLALLY